MVRAADVTTVGYGDVTPKESVGRFIAAVVMLAGIGLLAVITASVTASLVESSRRRFTAQSEADDTRQFDEISERLAKIEAALEQQAHGSSPDDPLRSPVLSPTKRAMRHPGRPCRRRARFRLHGAGSDVSSPARVRCGVSSIATPSTSPSD